MQTFDMALFNLYKSGQITIEEALKNADSKNNLRLRVTLDGKKPQEKGKKETSQAAAPAAAKPPRVKFNVAGQKAAKEAAPAEDMEGLSLLSIEEEEEDEEENPPV